MPRSAPIHHVDAEVCGGGVLKIIRLLLGEKKLERARRDRASDEDLSLRSRKCRRQTLPPSIQPAFTYFLDVNTTSLGVQDGTIVGICVSQPAPA